MTTSPSTDTPAEQLKISGKSIADFYARCIPGVRLECVENTYRPAATGTTGVVTSATKSSVDLDLDNGAHGRINIPKRVSEVVALTPDSITRKLAGGNGKGTATWRILPDEAAQ